MTLPLTLRCNPMHPVMALCLCCMFLYLLQAYVGRTSVYLMCLLAAEPHCTAGLSLPSHYLFGVILLTLYLMGRAWRFLKAGPMLFHWPKLLIPFSSSTFSHSLSYLYGLVMWGWELRTWWGINLFLPALHCRPFLMVMVLHVTIYCI